MPEKSSRAVRQSESARAAWMRFADGGAGGAGDEVAVGRRRPSRAAGGRCGWSGSSGLGVLRGDDDLHLGSGEEREMFAQRDVLVPGRHDREARRAAPDRDLALPLIQKALDEGETLPAARDRGSGSRPGSAPPRAPRRRPSARRSAWRGCSRASGGSRSPRRSPRSPPPAGPAAAGRCTPAPPPSRWCRRAQQYSGMPPKAPY